jgi:hypothetical protein
MSRQLTAAIAFEAPNMKASQMEIGAMVRISSSILSPIAVGRSYRGSKTAFRKMAGPRHLPVCRHLAHWHIYEP